MRKFSMIPQGKWLFLLWMIVSVPAFLFSQTTFPVNGVADPKEGAFAFINATIVKDAQTTINKGILLIREGKIVAAGTNITLPKDAVVIDCEGKYIYPSFIDIYSDYGMAAPRKITRRRLWLWWARPDHFQSERSVRLEPGNSQ